MAGVPTLTTTSYAILSLLSLREWSAYEMVQRMDRSLRWYWPRAQSKLYEEPKKLVAVGYARTRSRKGSRRRQAVYRITPAGRRALAAWLQQPGAGPVLEFEALLKVAFADQGSLDGLRANLQAVHEEAAQVRAFGLALADEFLAGAPTFSERLHVGVLVWEHMDRWAAQRADWARFALGWIDGWDGVAATPDRIAAAREHLERRLAERTVPELAPASRIRRSKTS
jgi:DNA-binding PadR family transcriptional regulator